MTKVEWLKQTAVLAGRCPPRASYIRGEDTDVEHGGPRGLASIGEDVNIEREGPRGIAFIGEVVASSGEDFDVEP